MGATAQARSPRAALRFVVRNYLRRRRTLVDAPIIWFINNWSRSYFHWLTDAIPRLYSVRNHLPSVRVVLPSNYRDLDFVVSSLRALGVREPLFIPEGEIYEVEQLILPSETAVTGNYNDDLMGELRATFVSAYDRRDRRYGGKRIYISRNGADRRHILNENEVVDTLKEYDFATIRTEKLTFAEQVRTSMDAAYMISNHGAGLTNMLFMKPGGRVLELRKEGDAHNNCYFSLASAVDLDYFYQTCNSDTPDRDPNVADLIVDTVQLRANVESMLTN